MIQPETTERTLSTKLPESLLSVLSANLKTTDMKEKA